MSVRVLGRVENVLRKKAGLSFHSEGKGGLHLLHCSGAHIRTQHVAHDVFKVSGFSATCE